MTAQPPIARTAISKETSSIAGQSRRTTARAVDTPHRARVGHAHRSWEQNAMCASEVVKKDNVGAILDRALDAGGGLLRLTPTWVPRSFLHPGKRIKLAPTDWYALGTHRGGIDERWFASTTEAANDNRAADEGLSYCHLRGQAVPAPRRRGRGRAADRRQGDLGQVQALAGLLEVLRQHGPDPAPHAPAGRARRADRPGRQARVLLLPAAAQHRREPFRLHVHGPGAGHDEGRRPPLPGELEQGRQRHPRSVEGVSPEARHRLDDSRRRAARPRLAVHLRAAMGLATCSACTSRWSKGREVPWALLVKDVPKDKHQRPRLHHRAARLGEERRSALQGAQLPRADRRQPSRPGTGYTDRWIDYGRRRRAAGFGQGTDGRARREVHAEGPRRERLDHRARQRPDGQARPADAGDDPLRRGAGDEVFITARGGRRPASRSRTPAASRWSACATSARHAQEHAGDRRLSRSSTTREATRRR